MTNMVGTHDMTNAGRVSLGPTVAVRAPNTGQVSLSQLLAQLGAADTARPFAPERVAFVATMAGKLRRAAAGNPALQALAFWMRPSEVAKLAEAFAGLEDATTLLMPRGTVFHVPPANVDTMFAYSLVLSVLAGNRNIVRLPTRAGENTGPILQAITSASAAHPDVAGTLALISYGHDEDVNRALTAACDVRVLWGGDATIATFRALPLPPHATELAFADRFSMAAFDTARYAELSHPARDDLADRFVTDNYWFDQLGCSSSRLVIWVGQPNADLAEDFHARVRRHAARRGFTFDTAAAIAKLGHAYRAMIDGDITALHWYDNSQTVLDTAGFPDARGPFCGGGLFYQWQVPDLAALIPHIQRADQTLAVFGFTRAQLRDFAVALCGRGIDRIVPVGSALQFNRTWDGHDLLQSLTRRVSLPAVTDR